jgi:hypothetical protein
MALPSGNKPGIHWAPGPVWTGAEIPIGIRSPDRPPGSHSLYRLRYSGPPPPEATLYLFTNAGACLCKVCIRKVTLCRDILPVRQVCHDCTHGKLYLIPVSICELPLLAPCVPQRRRDLVNVQCQYSDIHYDPAG